MFGFFFCLFHLLSLTFSESCGILIIALEFPAPSSFLSFRITVCPIVQKFYFFPFVTEFSGPCLRPSRSPRRGAVVDDGRRRGRHQEGAGLRQVGRPRRRPRLRRQVRFHLLLRPVSVGREERPEFRHQGGLPAADWIPRIGCSSCCEFHSLFIQVFPNPQLPFFFFLNQIL